MAPKEAQLHGVLTPLPILDHVPKPIEVHRRRTFVTCGLLLLAWIANDVALAWIHERVPRGVPPLPDLWFSFFPELTGAIYITEYLMIAVMANAIIVIICHQHRWVVARRVVFIAALCYGYRALCITLIQVPVPSVKTYCAPKTEGADFGLVARRVLGMFSSAGIESLRQRVLCGDLILSGHTLSLFIGEMTFKQYAPKKLSWLSYVLTGCSIVGVICILLARKHYTIDVVLGYYLATRTFWSYHSLVQVLNFGTAEFDKSLLARTFWAPIVKYLEADAPPPSMFVNRLQWPSACPQLLRRKCAY